MNYIELFGEWKTIGKDTQYRVVDTLYEYIIIFQGSQSKEDWKNNFKFRKKPYKNMPIPFSVHRGFLEIWKEINDYFLQMVRYVEKPITIVGHSHGGAIATLCAEDIWFNFPEKRNDLKLVTYGTPRIIGWRNYSKIQERWYNAENYSVVHDLVSHVPFFLVGYTHTNTLIKLENKNKFKIISNHGLDVYERLLYKE